MDGFTAVGLIAWFIFSAIGLVGITAVNGVTRRVSPVIEGPLCSATTQSTGRVQFWKSIKGWGIIKADDGESVYALWHKLDPGMQLREGQHVRFDTDRSDSSGKPTAVNLTVCQ